MLVIFDRFENILFIYSVKVWYKNIEFVSYDYILLIKLKVCMICE